MNDSQRGIHNYVPPDRLDNVADYDQSQPSIIEMATVHGRTKNQFSSFSILCQKQLLNVYRVNECLLSNEQKKTKRFWKHSLKKTIICSLNWTSWNRQN